MNNNFLPICFFGFFNLVFSTFCHTPMGSCCCCHQCASYFNGYIDYQLTQSMAYIQFSYSFPTKTLSSLGFYDSSIIFPLTFSVSFAASSYPGWPLDVAISQDPKLVPLLFSSYTCFLGYHIHLHDFKYHGWYFFLIAPIDISLAQMTLLHTSLISNCLPDNSIEISPRYLISDP